MMVLFVTSPFLSSTYQQPEREAFPIMPQKQESRNCC